jgi:hypothetical protein
MLQFYQPHHSIQRLLMVALRESACPGDNHTLYPALATVSYENELTICITGERLAHSGNRKLFGGVEMNGVYTAVSASAR